MKLNSTKKEHRKISSFFLLLLFILVFAWVGYAVFVAPAAASDIKYWMYTGKPADSTESGILIRNGDTLEQTVRCEYPLRGVSMGFLCKSGNQNTGNVLFSVFDAADGTLLAQENCSIADYDESPVLFCSLEESCHTASEQYRITVQFADLSKDTDIELLTSSGSAAFSVGSALLNGAEIPACAFLDLTLTYETLPALYWGVVCLIALVACLLYLVLCVSRWSIPGKTAAAILLVGILLLVVYPPFNTPDEDRHFGTVYYYASSIMSGNHSALETYSDSVSDDTLTVYKLPARGTDAIISTFGSNKFSCSDYIRFYHNLFASVDADAQSVNAALFLPAFPDSGFAYWPMILGVMLGWLFHLNGCSTVLLARLFSLFVYTFLCYISLRLIPRRRTALALVMLLPMSLLLSISCANDALLLGVSFLCLSMILHIHTEHRPPSVGEWTVLFLCFAQMIVARQFHILLFIIPLFVCCILASIPPRGKRTLALACIGLASVILLFYLFFYFPQNTYSLKDMDSAANYGYNFPLVQPLAAFGIIVQTILHEGGYYFQGMFGDMLGWLKVNLGVYPLLIFMTLILGAVLIDFENGRCTKQANRSWLITGILVWLAVFDIGFRWTTPKLFAESGNSLWGLQGRYFLPGLAPVCIGLPTFDVKISGIKESSLLHIAVWTDLVVVFHSFLLILALL